MRLLSLALALAAALPFTAAAQSSIAPGVTFVPGGAASMNMPGQANFPAQVPGQVGVQQSAPLPPESIPGNPVSAPSVDLNANQPATAAEQGFGSGREDAEHRRMLEDIAARSTPRQKGIVVPAPKLRNPVGSDAASREWLGNWTWALSNVGVSKDKIQFEASRLSRADFEAWASRQLRFRHGEHARVEVIERPELAPAH